MTNSLTHQTQDNLFSTLNIQDVDLNRHSNRLMNLDHLFKTLLKNDIKTEYINSNIIDRRINETRDYLERLHFIDENIVPQFINLMLNRDYTITTVVNMIDLNSVPPAFRHYELCRYKCISDFRNLNYVLNEEFLERIWSELFFSARNKNVRFNANYKLPRNGNTLLMMAAKFCNYNCVYALCAYNAYINIKNHNGNDVFNFLRDADDQVYHENYIKIRKILYHCLNRDANICKKSIITPDWTCYSTRITNNNGEMYSCGDRSSGGGGSSENCRQSENRYSAGYKGMTSDGCGEIYSGFNF